MIRRTSRDHILMKLLNKLMNVGGLLSLVMVTEHALAAGGGPKIISHYEILLFNFFGLESHQVDLWAPTVGGLLSLAILTLLGLGYRSAVMKAGDDVVPDGRFSLRTVVEMLLDFVVGLVRDIIGKEKAAPFISLLTGTFLFILISNLSGLVPGFFPATESINTNLAMGISIFLVYNYAGIKEHGASYIKQFLGPMAFLAPLLFCIELVAHFARPVSLSLRLLGNIFGDHLVLSVFTGLTYLVVPAALLFFGLMVACLQSFVFTLLSSIYVKMAISHDH